MEATDCECMLPTKGCVARGGNCKFFPLSIFSGSCFKYFIVKVSQVLIYLYPGSICIHVIFSICLLTVYRYED